MRRDEGRHRSGAAGRPPRIAGITRPASREPKPAATARAAGTARRVHRPRHRPPGAGPLRRILLIPRKGEGPRALRLGPRLGRLRAQPPRQSPGHHLHPLPERRQSDVEHLDPVPGHRAGTDHTLGGAVRRLQGADGRRGRSQRVVRHPGHSPNHGALDRGRGRRSPLRLQPIHDGAGPGPPPGRDHRLPSVSSLLLAHEILARERRSATLLGRPAGGGDRGPTPHRRGAAGDDRRSSRCRPPSLSS